MANAEATGKVPKGTFRRWIGHTPNVSKLPEKVKKAAYAVGVKVAVEEAAEKEAPPQAGRETRLKLDHKPYEFYGVKRHFERAEVRKKEVGKHVTQAKDSSTT